MRAQAGRQHDAVATRRAENPATTVARSKTLSPARREGCAVPGPVLVARRSTSREPRLSTPPAGTPVSAEPGGCGRGIARRADTARIARRRAARSEVPPVAGLRSAADPARPRPQASKSRYRSGPDSRLTPEPVERSPASWQATGWKPSARRMSMRASNSRDGGVTPPRVRSERPCFRADYRVGRVHPGRAARPGGGRWWTSRRRSRRRASRRGAAAPAPPPRAASPGIGEARSLR